MTPVLTFRMRLPADYPALEPNSKRTFSQLSSHIWQRSFLEWVKQGFLEPTSTAATSESPAFSARGYSPQEKWIYSLRREYVFTASTAFVRSLLSWFHHFFLLETAWPHVHSVSFCSDNGCDYSLLRGHCLGCTDLNFHAPLAMGFSFHRLHCLPKSTSANKYLLTFHREWGSGHLLCFVAILFVFLSSLSRLKTRVQNSLPSFYYRFQNQS